MSALGIVWRPYAGVPAVRALANGEYTHDPVWFRSFLYAEERGRGLDHIEDLASPGTFRFDLSRGPAALILAAEPEPVPGNGPGRVAEIATPPAGECLERIKKGERERRARFPGRLHRSNT